jgi:hypothetical protein
MVMAPRRHRRDGLGAPLRDQTMREAGRVRGGGVHSVGRCDAGVAPRRRRRQRRNLPAQLAAPLANSQNNKRREPGGFLK